MPNHDRETGAGSSERAVDGRPGGATGGPSQGTGGDVGAPGATGDLTGGDFTVGAGPEPVADVDTRGPGGAGIGGSVEEIKLALADHDLKPREPVNSTESRPSTAHENRQGAAGKRFVSEEPGDGG